MADTKLDDLLAKQKAMSDLAESLAGETNVERIQSVAVELARRGEELEQMARAVEASTRGEAPRGYTEVVLTPAQRDRIREKTGVSLESIRIPDAAGVSARVMPLTDPRIIETQAVREAESIRAGREADAQMRAQLAEVIGAIEAVGNPALSEQLEKMKADPNSLGGVLKKP